MNNIFSDVMKEVEEHGAESKKLIAVSLVLSVVLGLSAYRSYGNILLVLVVALCCFNAIRYMYRSEKGWLKIRTFRSHFVLRCLFLLVTAILIACAWALYLCGETDFALQFIQFEIIFLICAVTGFSNGIKVRKKM